MTYNLRLTTIIALILGLGAPQLKAQDSIPNIPLTNKAGSKYQFTIIKDNGASSVKNQNKSGTCWCFSTQSFLESELMRMEKAT